MNRVDKTIGWCDYTWNPVTGCSNDCPWCYARAMAHRFKRSFEPAFHPKRLDEPKKVKKPSIIFVCSAAELYDPEHSPDDIALVYMAAEEAPQHLFISLTQRPQYACPLGEYPTNWIQGFTARTEVELAQHAMHIPEPGFISIEPLLAPIRPDNCGLPEVFDEPKNIRGIAIGGMSGPCGSKYKATANRASALMSWAEVWEIPVYVKDNWAKLFPEIDWPKERIQWPQQGSEGDAEE